MGNIRESLRQQILRTQGKSYDESLDSDQEQQLELQMKMVTGHGVNTKKKKKSQAAKSRFMTGYKEESIFGKKNDKTAKILKNFKTKGGRHLYEQLNDIFKSNSVNKKSQA